MAVAFKRQYPSSSPGDDGSIIPLEVSRPELTFSLCFTNSPLAAPIALDPDWDVMEFWSNEVCLVGFEAASVVRPDSAGTPVLSAYLIRPSTDRSAERMILTKAGLFLSVIGLTNPGELFVSVLTRYQAIAIDESLLRG